VLRLLIADLLRPLITRTLPLLRPFRDDMVTMPLSLDLRVTDKLRFALCERVIRPFFSAYEPRGDAMSKEGDFITLIFCVLELNRSFFFDRDFFAEAIGEIRWLNGLWWPKFGLLLFTLDFLGIAP
jgi:hypothetical protein